jgi:hypothetical protein
MRIGLNRSGKAAVDLRKIGVGKYARVEVRGEADSRSCGLPARASRGGDEKDLSLSDPLVSRSS